MSVALSFLLCVFLCFLWLYFPSWQQLVEVLFRKYLHAELFGLRQLAAGLFTGNHIVGLLGDA